MNKTALKFAAKLSLIVALALLLPVLELALPINRFSFRAWEALMIRRREAPLPGLFYPNIDLTMTEVGDLAPYKDQQIARPARWRIDRAGYRNSVFCSSPEIIVAGDSMATGTGLSQSETVGDRLSQLTESCVYSFNHESLESALKTTVRWKWKPKRLVFVIVERTLEELAAFPVIENPPKIRRWKFFFQERGLSYPITLSERLQHSNFAQYRNAHGFFPAVSRALFGHEFTSGLDPKMLFFQGEPAHHAKTANFLQNRAELLASYKRGLKEMGIELLVVIVPNKESIYPELIPSQLRSPILPALYGELEKKRVPFLDLYHPFRKGFVAEKKFYYLLDDTHWNAEGAGLASQLIFSRIKSK